jgi:hypothetical protein
MRGSHPTRGFAGAGRLSLLAAAAFLAGCPTAGSGDDDSGGAPTPSPVGPDIELSTDAQWTEPPVLDFGIVDAGDSVSRILHVANVGDATLGLESVILPSSSQGFSLASPDVLPALLASGNSIDISISYTPTTDESIDDWLTVVSSDPDEPDSPVHVLAEGIAPLVAIQPVSWDFGNLQPGCVADQDLTITNIGRAELRIDTISFEDLGGGGEMALSGSPDTPLWLETDASIAAIVTYAPSDAEPDSGVLHVLSNDPSTPDATANAFGIAHEAKPKIDEYLQGDPEIDILFVIDNSSSVADEQSSFSVEFPAAMTEIADSTVAYHVGVVTTDAGGLGHLEGSVAILTPAVPDVVATFAANSNRGTSGSEIEQGLETAYLALSPPNIDPGGWNDGFLRSDATLAIVFVTDEMEQSASVRGWTSADYVAYYQSLKADSADVLTCDVSGQVSGCSGSSGTATQGVGYLEATTMTGGLSLSICWPGWGGTLGAALATFAPDPAVFELSEYPVPGSVEVRVDNVPATTGWSYDDALNAVVFAEPSIPPPGSEIAIEYRVLSPCGG